MIEHIADGIQATGTGTRILALLLLAGTIRRTIRVEYALGTTALIGIAKVTFLALARASILARSTTCIRSTRTWIAGIQLIQLLYALFNALHERIAFHTFGTGTAGSVREHTTQSRLSTQSRTRIAALLIDASLLGRTFRAGHTFRSTIRRNSNVVR